MTNNCFLKLYNCLNMVSSAAFQALDLTYLENLSSKISYRDNFRYRMQFKINTLFIKYGQCIFKKLLKKK